MRRVLKNDLKEYRRGFFRGREVFSGPKHTQVFNMKDEEERALYYYWKETYSLRDTTAHFDQEKLKGGEKDGL